MKRRPPTWREWMGAWAACVLGWALADLGWMLGGGSFASVPEWLELLSGFVMALAYWHWRAELMREQTVSEEEPG